MHPWRVTKVRTIILMTTRTEEMKIVFVIKAKSTTAATEANVLVTSPTD
jgi:hypothetical protein